MAKKRCPAGSRRVRGYTIRKGPRAGKRVHRTCRLLVGRKSRPLRNHITRRGTCGKGFYLVPAHQAPRGKYGKRVPIRAFCRKRRG